MSDGVEILFFVLFISVFVWFWLCSRLFQMIKVRHPEKYNLMGMPHLFKNNTPTTNIAFFKFLLKREWRSLNDEDISKLGKIMSVFIVIYTFLIISIFFVFSQQVAP